MFEQIEISKTNKQEFYRELTQQAYHLMDGEPSWIANLSNVSALLNVHLENINWVGFYLWSDEDGELVLGPFQGKPACIRIGLGRGVCGTAMESGQTVVVEDVLQFPGHIACDGASRSEVVVPLIRDGKKLGVLDIDAPFPSRFDQEDAAGLEKVAETILQHANL